MHKYGNRFSELALEHPVIARKLAHAFATSDDWEQLYACMRFADRLSCVSLGTHSSFVYGLLRGYEEAKDYEYNCPGLFGELAQHAESFLECDAE